MSLIHFFRKLVFIKTDIFVDQLTQRKDEGK